MISARIVADSLAPCGKRLTTYVLKYPRFIHADLMTHRDKSRNGSSSRAMPVHKMLWLAINEPVYPIHWGQNQKGMQATNQLVASKRWLASLVWRASCYSQVFYAWLLSKLGVHKQVANRLIEPFAHMTVVCSGTEWENFFGLRAHKDAQPEFQELAYCMLEAYLASTPRVLVQGEWHMPFADRYLAAGLSTDELLKIATARCARVSYLNFEGDIAHAKDFRLHDDLLAAGHLSPFEHCASAESLPVRSGNFIGFSQYRKRFANELRRLTTDEMRSLLATRRAA